MKVVKLKTYIFRSANFTGISILLDGTIRFYKAGSIHKNNGPAYIRTIVNNNNFDKLWVYNGGVYGYKDDFTIKTWKRRIKQIKQIEKFKIFL